MDFFRESVSADSPYSVAPQKGRQRHKMQWKKSDKEGRGIDQLVTSPIPSPVNFKSQLCQAARRRVEGGEPPPRSKSTRCSKPSRSSAARAVPRLELVQGLQSAAASEGEYEPEFPRLQKYKLAASCQPYFSNRLFNSGRRREERCSAQSARTQHC